MAYYVVQPDLLTSLIQGDSKPKVLILIITEAGSSGGASSWESGFLFNTIFKYKCMQELFCEVTRRKVVLSFITSGTCYHKDLLEIYGIDVVPLIIVINTSTGSPTGLIKIDPERESYCALALNNAISAALIGASALHYRVIRETYGKSVSTIEEIPSTPMEIDKNACMVGVYEHDNNTRDVAIQFNMCPSKKTWMLPTPSTNTVNSLEERMQQPKTTDAVWTIERTSPLPIEAVSRLQILLPSHGPLHAAVSELATMMDVSKFVSGVLNTPSQSLEISSRYPYRIFSQNEMSRTICDLGLAPSAVLIVKIKTELARPDWTLTDVIHNLMATVTKPFLAVLSGLWSRVQSIFYSSSEEDEADGDENEDSLPRHPKKRQSNVRTLWDEEDDEHKNDYDDYDDDDDDDDEDYGGRVRVPNYNGNSTQLL